MLSELLKPPNCDIMTVDIKVILPEWDHYLLPDYSPETAKAEN